MERLVANCGTALQTSGKLISRKRPMLPTAAVRYHWAEWQLEPLTKRTDKAEFNGQLYNDDAIFPFLIAFR